MDYKGYVEELKRKCDVFLEQVEFAGNETAYTDSLLEDVFVSVERLKDFYNKTVNPVVEDELRVVQTMDELKAYFEDKGWWVSECDVGWWEVGQSSPAGEDFFFSFMHDNDVEDAVKEIQRYAYDFDVDEHVETVMGMRGAPGLSELVEDAHEIQKMLDELADGVNWCEQKSISETLAEASERSGEDKMKFVDNRIQSVISGDPKDDPGFDEFDLC